MKLEKDVEESLISSTCFRTKLQVISLLLQAFIPIPNVHLNVVFTVIVIYVVKVYFISLLFCWAFLVL